MAVELGEDTSLPLGENPGSNPGGILETILLLTLAAAVLKPIRHFKTSLSNVFRKEDIPFIISY